MLNLQDKGDYRTAIRGQVRRGARVEAQGSGCDWSRWSGRSPPRNSIEVEEIQRIGLCRITRGQMRADEPAFDELDHDEASSTAELVIEGMVLLHHGTGRDHGITATRGRRGFALTDRSGARRYGRCRRRG